MAEEDLSQYFDNSKIYIDPCLKMQRVRDGYINPLWFTDKNEYQKYILKQNNMDVTVNQTAEGKTFDFLPKSAIKTDELKTFQFDSPGQYIRTENKEFSAVCPFSGLPDIATVIIEYFPAANKAVELKALKYYLTSFRNVGIYQEGVTAKIYRDLSNVLGFNDLETFSLNSLRVTTIYNVRGGFYTTCVEGKIDTKNII